MFQLHPIEITEINSAFWFPVSDRTIQGYFPINKRTCDPAQGVHFIITLKSLLNIEAYKVRFDYQLY